MLRHTNTYQITYQIYHLPFTMDVFATKKVTRKSCDKTHKGKFSKRASPPTQKPKHPTKPKTEPRNGDRYAFDFTPEDDSVDWGLDDDWDFDFGYFEQPYKDEHEWNGWLCLVG